MINPGRGLMVGRCQKPMSGPLLPSYSYHPDPAEGSARITGSSLGREQAWRMTQMGVSFPFLPLFMF